jgi:predicted alpha/beta superfamily hydrolase
MKPCCFTSMITVFLLFCSFGMQAQTTQPKANKVCLDNTEQFQIESKSVPGENYIIQVGLPIGYSPSKRSYPVLYVLDGDKSFGMTKEIADWLMWSNEIRDIIVIGISYGKGTDIWWEKRARDYTHCNDTVSAKGWFKSTGGADNFLKFMKNELFPAIDNNYSTNKDSVTIAGISFGGMLSTYVLFTQPEMFNGYIIIAPPLSWNYKSIFKLETEYFRNHKELDKTVYMAYGTLDDKDLIIDPTDEFIRIIRMRNYEGLKFVPQIFEGETHISVYSTALTNGLKNVFKR